MKRIFRAISTPTARSSAVFYFGSFGLSIFRYLFHLILLRLLAPAAYGEFLSYLSLIYLLGIPTGTIATVIIKYVAEFKGKDDKVSINLFFHYLLRTVTPIAVFLGIALIFLSGPLSFIFKANSLAFIVLGISVFISLYQTIIGSYLVAYQKFVFQTIVGFAGVLVTIVLSIFFIRLGFGATGAVIGQLLGSVATSVIIFLNVRPSVYPKIVIKKSPHFSLGGLMGYSFIYALGTMSLISTDILMVRALFDPHLSGIYSALSILGRMILFGLTPLVALVLPIAAHRHAASGSARSILMKLGAVVLLFGATGAGIFSLFPTLIIRVLSGSAYLEAAPFLSIFAFTMVFFALSQFILSYLMAIGRPRANIFLLVATIAQPILFYVFRGSFPLVIWSNFGLHLLLTTFLIVFLLSRNDHKVFHPSR
ncbi:MAG: polysaccharide biosynthesis protein [uncultured bacterium]|nr:MAG: polysaccharide biosynthesis protein [uncultured bacterium]